MFVLPRRVCAYFEVKNGGLQTNVEPDWANKDSVDEIQRTLQIDEDLMDIKSLWILEIRKNDSFENN